jgi:uncharacterized protein
VSKQRYMVRRLLTAGLAVLVVVTLGAGVSSLLGGGEPIASTPESGAPATDPPVTDPSATEPSVTEPSTTEPPDTGPPDTGPPTPENKAKVLILGDSDAGTFGPYLMSLLEPNGVTDSDLFYKVSSGLSRPDFYDWPADLEVRLPEEDPDILVVTFGGNDAQDILIDGASRPVDSDEWRAEYGRRVGEVMDMMTEGGRTLIWVGIPNASEESFTKRLEILRDVTLAEIEKRPDSVIYVDTWNRFAGLSGGYADYVVDPRDGQGKNVRASDGFHLNVTGAEILALDIARVVEDELRSRGADI